VIARKRREVVDLPVTAPVAHTRVVAALATLGATFRPASPPGTIRAVRPMSWQSWGEKITVWLVPTSYGTRVVIQSRSAWRTTLVDWGRNQDNVDQIAAMITSGPPAPIDAPPPARTPVDAATPQDRAPTGP
jgi:hypothetical protein